MASTLANSDGEERGSSFGPGPPDPAQRAFDAHPTPTPFHPAQPDTLPPPVERIPAREAAGGSAGAWPLDSPGPFANVWTGLHGAVAHPEVGAIGPDVQPAEPAFRRNLRNRPEATWDDGSALPTAGGVSPYG